MALAAKGKIKHTIKTIGFDQINEYLDMLRAGDIVGRAVVSFGSSADRPTPQRAELAAKS